MWMGLIGVLQLLGCKQKHWTNYNVCKKDTFTKGSPKFFCSFLQMSNENIPESMQIYNNKFTHNRFYTDFPTVRSLPTM